MAYATCTRFRVVCPECGRVGVASWTHDETDVVRCRGCGARFAYRQHTYRPATAGMSEEERAERRRELDCEYRARRRELGKQTSELGKQDLDRQEES